MNVGTDIANAPKETIGFFRKHLAALLFTVLVFAIIFVALEARKPGRIRNAIGRIPVIGPKLVGAAAAVAVIAGIAGTFATVGGVL